MRPQACARPAAAIRGLQRAMCGMSLAAARGPDAQGQKRSDLPQGEALLDSALDALEKSVAFTKGKL